MLMNEISNTQDADACSPLLTLAAHSSQLTATSSQLPVGWILLLHPSP